MARTQGSHSGITGPRVIEAALKLFARHGYAAVSMRQIAREVGVQAGALYNYTPDKQTLLFNLLVRHMDLALDGVREVADAGDPLSQLQAYTRFHISHHYDHQESLFITYMELRNLEPDNFAKLEEMRRLYEDILEQILRQGVEDGVMHVADTKVATMAIIAMLNGVNTWFRDGGRLERDEVTDIYWRMVRGVVGA